MASLDELLRLANSGNTVVADPVSTAQKAAVPASSPTMTQDQLSSLIAGLGNSGAQQNTAYQAAAPTIPASANTQTVNAYAAPAFNMNLPGVSDATKAALNDLVNNGYVPSQTVNDALKELNDIIEGQPASFSSQWADQIDAIMDQINGRAKFSYDAATDPTYQLYKDQYQRQGQTAMADTMGQAAALTGGYGSSYGQAVGQQTYQGYLSQLNNALPELQNAALNQYNSEGDAMNAKLALLNSQQDQDRADWQQGYNVWADKRDTAQNAYDSAKQLDYNSYENKLDYYRDLAAQESAQYADDKKYAYQNAMSIFQMGKMPSAEVLAAAGISEADAKKYYNYYKSSSGGSGSNRTSGSGSGGSSSPTTNKPATDFNSLYQAAQNAFTKNKMPTAKSVIGAPGNAYKSATSAASKWISDTVKKKSTPKQVVKPKSNRITR
jgi:hypothetical protein